LTTFFTLDRQIYFRCKHFFAEKFYFFYLNWYFLNFFEKLHALPNSNHNKTIFYHIFNLWCNSVGWIKKWKFFCPLIKDKLKKKYLKLFLNILYYSNFFRPIFTRPPLNDIRDFFSPMPTGFFFLHFMEHRRGRGGFKNCPKIKID
jgi:hypothetical protein